VHCELFSRVFRGSLAIKNYFLELKFLLRIDTKERKAHNLLIKKSSKTAISFHFNK